VHCADCLDKNPIQFDGVTYIERVKIVESDPARKPPTTRIDDKRFSILSFRQTDTAHDVGA